jgi:CheY-like chemotaxis protein
MYGNEIQNSYGPETAFPMIVLVVEDEALLRTIAAEYLAEAGFEVIEAADAKEALHVLEGFTQVDCLFTDVHMPGSMNGFSLAERTHRNWPHIKLVITSGLMRPARADLPDHATFLPKPYGEEQLVAALRTAGPPSAMA